MSGFLKALAGETTEHVPFWFMRQAGRYLPEYRALREKSGGFLAMAMDPVAACEITLQPIRRFGMDAAIIFSDILVVPQALGQHLEFMQGEGPKLEPIRDASALARLKEDGFDSALAPVYEALRQTSSALRREGFADTALIGFAGAPWTVATYMVEGGGSKDFHHVKKMAYADPVLFSKLVDMLVDSTARYLIRQVEAGAQAVQLFDSWAGVLDSVQFEKWVIKPTKEIVSRFKAAHPKIPFIGFPRGAGLNYEAYAAETGVGALGLDTTIPSAWAAEKLQTRLPVQGNLDPLCLLAGGVALRDTAQKILDDFSGGPFVFNLGHGIDKDTPVAHVEELVSLIKGYTRR